MKGVSAKAVPFGGEEAKRKARCKGGRLALPGSGPDGHKKTYGTTILVSKGINVNKITKNCEKKLSEAILSSDRKGVFQVNSRTKKPGTGPGFREMESRSQALKSAAFG